MTKKRALIIGIDDYSDAPLECCVNDAQELAATLQMEEYDYQTTTLIDSVATRRAILREIEAARIDEPSVFIFYFSGHGCTTNTGTYLVTHDGEPFDEGISVDTISRALSTISSSDCTTLAILDCCHSGEATPWATNAKPVSRSEIEQAIPLKGEGRVVLAACRPSEYSYEDAIRRHGLFTGELLDGLLGAAADHEGTITVNSLYDYVCRLFVKETKQTPVFRADIAGIIELASGFTPRLGKPAGKELSQELERQANQLLDDYVNRTKVSFNEWKETGYVGACQALEPILRWFRSRVGEYPELQGRKKFAQLYDAAKARLAQLGNVDPGTRLQRGELAKQLGDGAFGSVWKIEPISSGDVPLAYKIYHPHDLHMEEKVARFSRGYRAMQQLDHPNIVRVQGYTECPVGFFMDFIDGPNLRSLVAGLDEAITKVSIVYTVAQTLRHAHGRGVIHRDIKPENIIATYDQDSKAWIPHLTDFDLAWFSTATQLTRDAMGTMFYAAPEQLGSPKSKMAHQSTVDIYSFGQLCFFIATGSDPVPLGLADNQKVLRERISNWPSERAARQFFDLYVSCSEFDPKDRVSDFDQIIDKIGSSLQALRELDEDLLMRPDMFLRELSFAVVGLDTEATTATKVDFRSTSGRTDITLRAKEVHGEEGAEWIQLEARFAPSERLVMEGVTHDRARIILNSRIDSAIHGYGGVRRRSGKYGSFEVYLDFMHVTLDVAGIAECRPVISRIIGAIEAA